MLAGLRGEEDAAEVLAAEARTGRMRFGARAVLSVSQMARGVAALGGGRYAEPTPSCAGCTPADPAYHQMKSCWAIGDLAEAAVRSGRREESGVDGGLELRRRRRRRPGSTWPCVTPGPC